MSVTLEQQSALAQRPINQLIYKTNTSKKETCGKMYVTQHIPNSNESERRVRFEKRMRFENRTCH